ncbi:hypothetical protein [Amycolatopsis sacchari]|uniref:hypothetical protein n=1 Tax=Amycolatopsis sacchari TaxID=115433 RepID=UPI003D719C33
MDVGALLLVEGFGLDEDLGEGGELVVLGAGDAEVLDGARELVGGADVVGLVGDGWWTVLVGRAVASVSATCSVDSWCSRVTSRLPAARATPVSTPNATSTGLSRGWGTGTRPEIITER